MFDDNDEEFPQPASVLEVDWSLLQVCDNSKLDKGKNNVVLNSRITFFQISILLYLKTAFLEKDAMPDFLCKLFPGSILAEIGYSPSLLKRSTLKRVQEACLACKRIESRTLEPSEEVKLQTGMAATVRKVFKNRSARNELFLKSLIGLKNDLGLRRELRKPVDKVTWDSPTNY